MIQFYKKGKELVLDTCLFGNANSKRTTLVEL